MENEQALVEEAYARLEIWEQGCREIHERARESRQILLLQDPEQDTPGHGPVMQMQTLKSTFNNCVADQTDNLPEALMIPETPALEPVAGDLSDVVRFILSRNDFETLHRRRAEDCFCTGTAVTQIMWDSTMDGGRGNVALLRWPIESFLWDPAADSLQEGRAVFKLSLHPMSWYQAHYPDKAGEIAPDGELRGYMAAGVPGEGFLAQDEPFALMLEYWRRRFDPGENCYHVDAAAIAGGKLLWNAPDIYRHGLYPFVLDVYTPIEGTPVGEGLIQEMAPMMRAVNRYQSYIDTNLRMSSKGRLLVDRGAGIDKDALCDWEKDIIEGDRIDPTALQWLQTQPFGSLAAQQLLQLQSDIKQDSGQNQFTRGETVGGVTAASAISALQEAGGKITRLRTAVLNRGFREMVEQVLWLVSQFYGRGRMVCITGGDGALRQIPAGAERLFGGEGGSVPPPPYTVQIQVQRRNPLRIQAQNELFLEAYRMAVQAGQYFPLSGLFELLQVDGKERILPLLRDAEGLRAELERTRQEREELRGMCEQAEEMLEEREKTEQGMEDALGKMMELMRGKVPEKLTEAGEESKA